MSFKLMKHFTAACLLVLTATTAAAQQPLNDGTPSLKPVMRQKLDHSKEILEGLALEDFDKIAKSSQRLGLLSLEAGWQILQTEEYVKQSLEFRRTAEVITTAAREKNLDRAALGYVALTVRCIECHGYLRKSHPELSSLQLRSLAPAAGATAAK